MLIGIDVPREDNVQRLRGCYCRDMLELFEVLGGGAVDVVVP
jgi:hypothetical protein